VKLFFACLLLVICNFPQFSYASFDLFNDEWSQTDFSKAYIEPRRVVSLRSKKDDIPPIDNPIFKPASQINDIPLGEPVVAIYLNGVARAYPLRILLWHGVVNDKVGDSFIAVTYDHLSNSAMVFERKLGDVELKFAASGKIYKSNMLLYDNDSKSWWQQYTGEAVVGERLGSKLTKITSRVESLSIFSQRHPQGEILVPNDFIRKYGLNPYPYYDTEKIPFLYDGEYKGYLSAMEYLVVVGSEAWPLGLLQQKGTIKKDDLVLLWTPYQNSVLDNPIIYRGRDLGNVTVIKKASDGVYKDTLYQVSFAFMFDAFHPNGILHKEIKTPEK
jgi:hypothetical protein